MPRESDSWSNYGKSSRVVTRRPVRRTGGGSPPQSEQRFTEFGYNSPFQNEYRAQNANTYSRAGLDAAIAATKRLRLQGQPAAPAAPRYGGGGGGGYGGGGGGGGGSGMTQATFDAMIRALGTMGPKLDLPDFEGASLGAFNAAPYTQALGNIDQAVTGDLAASQAASTAADQALRANYSNAYANTQVAQAPQAAQVGNALQATAGGGGDQAAIAAQTNLAGGQDQAAFTNLLRVLAAADQQTQGSRLNQVALDRGTAERGINAQALGLRGGVNTRQAQAETEWQKAAAERDYQNRMIQHQTQQAEAQGNWQQRNELISGRMTPLLEMLASGGQLNTDALMQLLASWGA